MSMYQLSNTWFIIHSSVAPIYADPTFNAPCTSETVFGESCKVIGQRDNWLNIKCEDGYEGWINEFYGKTKSAKNKPTYIVVFPNEKGTYSHNYPFGAQIKQNITGSIQITDTLGIDQIIPVAKNLLGIPYKWGGKTSYGFDCSGLVQSVLKVCGLSIPRDSYQQHDFFLEDEIEIDEAEPGDLHFFGKSGDITHVGLSTGKKGILHSQGSVKEESLDIRQKLANKKLIDFYISTHSIRRKFNQ